MNAGNRNLDSFFADIQLNTRIVEQWDMFDLALMGPTSGNPFVDVSLNAEFIHDDRLLTQEGFYDDDGIYRIRFMADAPGEWHYITHSNRPILDAVIGSFTCSPASSDKHGPVRIHNTYHFAYADGTTYLPIGTTCYAWIHQAESLEQQTLETLSKSPFNKLRMCVLPKRYTYNQNEPLHYPFERGEKGQWDFTRFNPVFFKHLEKRLHDLQALGIEADLILFHPYDGGHWGFDSMGAEADERYLRYILARLSSFCNVWWSMANEYDLVASKTLKDWDRLFQIIQTFDIYQHPCSIHNWREHYNHSQDWISHTSIQTSVAYPDLEKVADWREKHQKPVIVDETCYEGNIPYRWGYITAQEMVHRFWLGTVLGGYVGHGETYLHPDDILWWSKGGVLHGESPARIAFLKQILDESPPGGLEFTTSLTKDLRVAAGGQDLAYFLAYVGAGQPAEARLKLPQDYRYVADLIDTWNMTVLRLDGTFQGDTTIKLPGKPFIALRLQRV